MVQSEPTAYSPLLLSFQGPDFLSLLALNPACVLRALQPLPLVCIHQLVERHILPNAFSCLLLYSYQMPF